MAPDSARTTSGYLGDGRGPATARRRHLVAELGVLLVALTLPAVVLANNWGAADSAYPGYSILCTDWNDPHFNDSECTPDDEFQYVYIAGTVPSGLRTALSNSIAEDYDALPEVWAYVYPTLNSVNDVRIWYWNEDPSLPTAFTTCAVTHTVGLANVRYHMWCKPQDILYQNNSGANSCWNYGPCRRHYACHELGHTFGLQHTSDSTSCMSYSASHPENLRTHDNNHLIYCFPHPTPPLPTYPAETRSASCKQ